MNYGQRAFVREDIKTQTAEKPEIPKRQRSLKNPKEKLIWQRLTPARLRGFDGMTADEKVTALLGLQIPDAVDLSGYVAKSVFDTKATEAANLSKQLKAKITEAETATGALTTAQAELEH